jgi:hypothetical protein
MANLEFCKKRLLEAAEFETVGNLRSQVTVLARRLLKGRLLEGRSRAALKTWAAEELRKLEVGPGSGMSKIVPSHTLGETSRKMAMFQTVLDVLDEVEASAAA